MVMSATPARASEKSQRVKRHCGWPTVGAVGAVARGTKIYSTMLLSHDQYLDGTFKKFTLGPGTGFYGRAVQSDTALYGFSGVPNTCSWYVLEGGLGFRRSFCCGIVYVYTQLFIGNA
eukprot:SAG11_NODE_2746_length_3014_cov_3.898799_4_plen_118_part_00